MFLLAICVSRLWKFLHDVGYTDINAICNIDVVFLKDTV